MDYNKRILLLGLTGKFFWPMLSTIQSKQHCCHVNCKTHKLFWPIYHSQPLQELLQYSKLQMAKTVVKISFVQVYNSYIHHEPAMGKQLQSTCALQVQEGLCASLHKTKGHCWYVNCELPVAKCLFPALTVYHIGNRGKLVVILIWKFCSSSPSSISTTF